MKILIADDNVAIQEVLKEILSEFEADIQISDSIEDTVTKAMSFNPDLIILDVDMEAGSGLKAIDRIHEEDVSRNMDVVILKNANELMPTDNTFIKGSVSKPFSSDEFIVKINEILFRDRTEPPQVKPRRESRRQKTEAVGKSLYDMKLSFGDSYVLFEESSKVINDAISAFGREGHGILLITSGKKKATRERFRGLDVEVESFAVKPRGNYFDVYKLGTLIDRIDDFIEAKESPVVAFDNLNQIVDRNGMNSVLMMIDQIFKTKHDKKRTFLISVGVKDFTDKDKRILLGYMERYNPE